MLARAQTLRPNDRPVVTVLYSGLGAIGFSDYWTANKVAAPYLRHRANGVEIKPKSAGTNALREHISFALIFSAKATKAVRR